MDLRGKEIRYIMNGNVTDIRKRENRLGKEAENEFVFGYVKMHMIHLSQRYLASFPGGSDQGRIHLQ